MAKAGLLVRQDAELRAILDNAKRVGPQGRGQDARVNRRDARERRSKDDDEKAMDGFFIEQLTIAIQQSTLDPCADLLNHLRRAKGAELRTLFK